MCWIGKKTGGKRFCGNWESIALEVDLLLVRFIGPSQVRTHTHALTHAHAQCSCTTLHAHTHLRAEDRGTNYSDWGGGQKKHETVSSENACGEKVEQWWCRRPSRLLSVSSGGRPKGRLFHQGGDCHHFPYSPPTKHLLPFVSHLTSQVPSDKATRCSPFIRLINTHVARGWQTRMTRHRPSESDL